MANYGKGMAKPSVPTARSGGGSGKTMGTIGKSQGNCSPTDATKGRGSIGSMAPKVKYGPNPAASKGRLNKAS